MLRIAVLVVVVLSAGLLAAQEETPVVEVFGGFAAARIDDNQGPTERHITNLGWDLSTNANFSRYFGLVADLGQYYGTHRLPPFTALTCPTCPMTTPSPFQASTKFLTFMGGPQLSFRWRTFTPFVRGMIGVANEHGHLVPTPPGGDFSTTLVGLAEALGGGLDVTLTHRVGLRFQADYLHNGFEAGHPAENNIRFATGVIFRLGARSGG
jgi:hypothetical protein